VAQHTAAARDVENLVGFSSNDPSRASVEHRFAEAWTDYSRHAERNRRRYKFHRFATRPVLHLSWLMLLFVLGALIWPGKGLRDELPYLVPGFSGLALVFAVWQMVCGYRQSWITYRTATEHLRQAYFRYRMGLPPYDGPRADKELDRELERVHKFVHETNEAPPGPAMTFWRLWKLRLPGARDSRAGEAILRLRLPRTENGDEHEDAASFLFSYMRDQQLWHYDKAKKYLARYLGLQLAIFLVSAFGIGLSLRFGPQIWILGLLGATNILLIYVGDFFDLAALFQRYYHVVAELRRLGHEYHVAEGAFAGRCDDERQMLLAAEVDRVLAREFDYWHARAGKSPKDRPDSAMNVTSSQTASSMTS
jgi:hypothetical protein